MANNNEYFTSEQVDEQIEHLLQHNTPQGQSKEAELVDVLQRRYQVPLGSEDRASLAHARQRLLDELNEEEILEPEPLFVNVSGTRPVAQSRRVRQARFLSSLAAVLVVAALLGSWFVVTRLAQPPHVASDTGQGSLYNIHSGIVYRIEANTGKIIWQHPVPTRKLSDPNHGGSASLQVVNSVVYAVFDFDIYALNATNGKQIWHITNPGTSAYFYFVVNQERLYLFSLDNTFSALDATNGTLLWHNTTFTTQNGYGFYVLNGNVYTQTSDSTPGEQKLVALDGATGKIRWSYPISYVSPGNSPLVANGVVYFSSGNTLFAVNEQNGSRIWEKQMPTVGDVENLYVVNNILYVEGIALGFNGGSNQPIYAMATSNGQLLWTSEPGFSAFQFSLTDDLLLASRQYNGTYSIAGLNPLTGKVVWQVPFTCNSVGHNPENPQVLIPSCGVSWSEIIDGTWYLLESDSRTLNNNQGSQNVYTLKSFNPGTGQLLSEHALETNNQDSLTVIGASNGLLSMTLGIPRTANTIPYVDIVFVGYDLRNAAQVWSLTMPPFPTPQGANTSPNTSDVVLIP